MQRLLTTVPLIGVVPAVILMVAHPGSRDAQSAVTSKLTFRARPWLCRPRSGQQRDTHTHIYSVYILSTTAWLNQHQRI